jgi:hypothetical protein
VAVQKFPSAAHPSEYLRHSQGSGDGPLLIPDLHFVALNRDGEC